MADARASVRPPVAPLTRDQIWASLKPRNGVAAMTPSATVSVTALAPPPVPAVAAPAPAPMQLTPPASE